MNGRSDRGDKKNRGGSLVVAVWSHPVSVTREGDKEPQGQRALGLAAHIQIWLTMFSIQLSLACQWSALDLLILIHSLILCEHQNIAGFVGGIPCHSWSSLSWLDGKSPRSRVAGVIHHLRAVAARVGCWGWQIRSWTDWEPVECPVWYSFILEGEKGGACGGWREPLFGIWFDRFSF